MPYWLCRNIFQAALSGLKMGHGSRRGVPARNAMLDLAVDPPRRDHNRDGDNRYGQRVAQGDQCDDAGENPELGDDCVVRAVLFADRGVPHIRLADIGPPPDTALFSGTREPREGCPIQA